MSGTEIGTVYGWVGDYPKPDWYEMTLPVGEVKMIRLRDGRSVTSLLRVTEANRYGIKLHRDVEAIIYDDGRSIPVARGLVWQWMAQQ